MKAKRMTGTMGIGIFSPSSPISAMVPVRYERGIRYLESKGFRIVHGRLFGRKDGYRSGTIKERAEEFNDLLYRDDVQILMSSIGGNNTNSILPYIDYEYLKKHPKMIIGYSDVTALLLAIYAKTGLVTFYGPAAAASFGELPPFVEWTYQYFERMMDGVSIPYRYEMPPVWSEEWISWDAQERGKEPCDNEWICVNPGICKGRLIGGNLNTMEGFFGTEYMPEIKDGDILLIEDCEKTASVIERSFSLLKLAGVFDRVGGVILGKHERFQDNGTGKRPYEIMMEVIGDTAIPILAEFDCCHTHPMFTMPIGCEVLMDAAEKRVELMESPFED